MNMARGCDRSTPATTSVSNDNADERKGRKAPAGAHAPMQEIVSKPSVQSVRSVLDSIAFAAFAASLSTRALDPVLPIVADEFAVKIATAASIAASYMLSFGAVQPLIGPMAELIGKARLMVGCLALLAVTNILSAFADSFFLLLAARILAGVASGGVVPVALSLASDLVAPEQRQVAIGRITAGVMIGTFLGASTTGLIGDLQGWRGRWPSSGSWDCWLRPRWPWAWVPRRSCSRQKRTCRR